MMHDLFVTYRSPNFQGGAVAVFTNDGTFLGQSPVHDRRQGPLQSPWGLAFIQQGFGEFSGDLLVGNFSSGQIDAYNVTLGSDPRNGTGGEASAVLDGSFSTRTAHRSQSPGSCLSISAPAWGTPEVRTSACSSPQRSIFPASGSIIGTSRSTARSRPPTSRCRRICQPARVGSAISSK